MCEGCSSQFRVCRSRQYRRGDLIRSCDKQILREWAESDSFDRATPPPNSAQPMCQGWPQGPAGAPRAPHQLELSKNSATPAHPASGLSQVPGGRNQRGFPVGVPYPRCCAEKYSTADCRAVGHDDCPRLLGLEDRHDPT
ncbi:hypothetical protein BT67DRAFT_167131 [Trichocladium antarcticum]|uniref:Uncharacterized protein n=1 Tax=Trichocladium antarcticum TaxID=1450529 RepID=A0AAN6ZB72_9PEZI|nr:hypothetical protein BT67DRAFT_167131 [Trichocladium antarcticum]